MVSPGGQGRWPCFLGAHRLAAGEADVTEVNRKAQGWKLSAAVGDGGGPETQGWAQGLPKAREGPSEEMEFELKSEA